jgi:hypothetical protein
MVCVLSEIFLSQARQPATSDLPSAAQQEKRTSTVATRLKNFPAVEILLNT